VTLNALPRSLVDNPELGAWISFRQQGRATVFAGKVELGQGIGTALGQIAADELDMAVDLVEVVPADTGHSPDEGFTAGSYSVEASGASVRLAAAQARAALLAAASTRLGATSTVTCRDGQVLLNGQPAGLDFWTLEADVDWARHVTGQTPVKHTNDHVAVGASIRRADIPAKWFAAALSMIWRRRPLACTVVRQPFGLQGSSRR